MYSCKFITFGGTGGRRLGGGSRLANGESGPAVDALAAMIFSCAFSMTERLSMALKQLSSAIGITVAEATDAEDSAGDVGEMRTLCRDGVLELEPSESEWWSTWNFIFR